MLVGLLGPVLPGYKSYHLSGDDIPPNPLGLLSFTQTATLHLTPYTFPDQGFCYIFGTIGQSVQTCYGHPLKIINVKFPMTLEMEEMLPLQNYELFINQALCLPHLWYSSCK